MVFSEMKYSSILSVMCVDCSVTANAINDYSEARETMNFLVRWLYIRWWERNYAFDCILCLFLLLLPTDHSVVDDGSICCCCYPGDYLVLRLLIYRCLFCDSVLRWSIYSVMIPICYSWPLFCTLLFCSWRCYCSVLPSAIRAVFVRDGEWSDIPFVLMVRGTWHSIRLEEFSITVIGDCCCSVERLEFCLGILIVPTLFWWCSVVGALIPALNQLTCWLQLPALAFALLRWQPLATGGYGMQLLSWPLAAAVRHGLPS